MSISEMRNIKIGTVNGRNVTYNRIDSTVKINGTSICIIGVTTLSKAIEKSKKAFHNFKGVQYEAAKIS